MTTKNRLAIPTQAQGELSPTYPRECCAWRNDRLHPDAVAANLHWVVTGNPGKPIELRRY